MLGALGAAGATAVAGCGADSSDDTPADQATPTPRVETEVVTREAGGEKETVIKTKTVQVTEEEEPTPTPELGANLKDDTFNSPGRSDIIPDTAQYNPYNSKQIDFKLFDNFIAGEFAGTQFTTGETTLFHLNDWSYEDTTVTHNLREDGLTWHDGTEFTAEDAVFQYHFGLYSDASNLSGFIGDQDIEDAVQAQDEFTWTIELESPIAEDLVELNVIADGSKTGVGPDISTPPQHFSEFMERYRDATTEEEFESIRNDVATFRVEDPIGTTQFKLAERRTNSWLLERHEDHPDPANWPFIEVEITADQTQQLAFNDVIDASADVSEPEQIDRLPDHWKVATRNKFGGQGAWFNHRHKDVGRPRVRQAVTWAIDHAKLAEANAASATPLDGNHSGVGIAEPSRFISQDVLDAEWNYRRDQASEMVPQLMEMAGYSKQNGVWVDPDGEEFFVEYNAPAGGSRLDPLGRIVVESMNEFDLNADLIAVEGANYWNKVGAGEADMNACCWGARNGPHALNDFNWRWGRDKEVEWLDQPLEIDIPEVGTDPMNEPSVTVEPRELINEFATAGEDRQQEIMDTLSWASNWQKPRQYFYYTASKKTFSTDDWDMPPLDSGAYWHGDPAGYAMMWEAVDDGHKMRAKTKDE